MASGLQIEEVKLNKALFLLVIPALTLTSGAALAQGEWYVEPSIAYVDDDPDRAVAEIIPELRKGEIQKGDRVRTKVS